MPVIVVAKPRAALAEGTSHVVRDIPAGLHGKRLDGVDEAGRQDRRALAAPHF